MRFATNANQATIPHFLMSGDAIRANQEQLQMINKHHASCVHWATSVHEQGNRFACVVV